MMVTNRALPSFGALLKTFRKRRSLTQQQLAAAIGVHRNAIGRWELGDFLPKQKTLVLEIASHLHLDNLETRQLLEASFTSLAPHWCVPLPRNPFFTGRAETLQTLHSQLGTNHTVALAQSSALHGLGGVGKTQIALEYAYRYALEYSAVFWIEAETMETVIASLLRIAELLALPGKDETDQQRVIATVQHWLRTHHNWLLICDNVEDLDLLNRIIPSSAHAEAILITTRNQVIGTLAQGLDLQPMPQEEGLLFLLRRAKLVNLAATSEAIEQFASQTPAEYTAALQLVAALGGLPLALDQAGAYIEETGCSLSGYLASYEQQQSRLLDRRGDHRSNHPQSVTTTFKLSVERAELKHHTAIAMLQVCAFLHADAIPEELFMQGAGYLGPELASLETDLAQFDQVIAVLRSLSLIQRQATRCMLSLHRLVQAVLRGRMSPQEQATWLKRIIAALNAIFPLVTYESWRQCERLLPHVLACAHATTDSIGGLNLAYLLQKAADYLRERAQYEQAEPLYQRALRIEQQMLGPEHADLVVTLNGLAILYSELEKHEFAEHYYQSALRIGEQAFGAEHPEIAHLLDGMADLDYKQGRYTRAEALYHQALRIHEQVDGPAHPLSAHSLYGLAYLYSKQGKYQQAEPLYQRTLQIQQQALGPTHPDLAKSLNGLAILYQEQGKYQQAEAFFQRTLHICEQTFGAEDPRSAAPTYSLALISFQQGKLEQAETLYQRALRIWEQTLGPLHPNIASPLNGLANLYLSQGKFDQVASLCQRALQIWEQALGPLHPNVGYPLSTLAELYVKQGKPEQAEPLYRRTLQIWEQSLGAQHPALASSLNELANLYLAQGKSTQARPLYQRALLIREQSLGPSHPDTAETLHDLALFYQQQGSLNKARSFANRALEIRSQTLGDTHPQTVVTRSLYDDLLQTQALEHPRTISQLHAEERLDLHGDDSITNSSHRETSDDSFVLQRFLDACCEIHPYAWCRISELRQAYEQWVRGTHERFPLSRRAFAAQLKAHGCRTDRTSTTRIWRGIALVRNDISTTESDG